jgi:hypothetical protein
MAQSLRTGAAPQNARETRQVPSSFVRKPGSMFSDSLHRVYDALVSGPVRVAGLYRRPLDPGEA